MTDTHNDIISYTIESRGGRYCVSWAHHSPSLSRSPPLNGLPPSPNAQQRRTDIVAVSRKRSADGTVIVQVSCRSVAHCCPAALSVFHSASQSSIASYSFSSVFHSTSCAKIFAPPTFSSFRNIPTPPVPGIRLPLKSEENCGECYPRTNHRRDIIVIVVIIHGPVCTNRFTFV
ncbi:unnamed protein product [Aphis gossypii]|uniref:Uncharacterized protein n=1 Tax=Aphis gossypii TaxID=80765 RepID=A0A9P0J1R8_APHGO|nr:unnamed protein product [Aphis gossypii]